MVLMGSQQSPLVSYDTWFLKWLLPTLQHFFLHLRDLQAGSDARSAQRPAMVRPSPTRP